MATKTKTTERKYEKIDEIIDILKGIYGEDESGAIVSLTNEQIAIIINALTVRKNVSEAICSMNKLAEELVNKENPSTEDQMQACFLAYGLNNMKLVAMEGDEIDE